MGEMGGDDFARGTARGIEAAMEERAAKASPPISPIAFSIALASDS